MTTTTSTRIPIAGGKLAVSPLCLGGNVFGWSVNQDAGFAVLDAYFEAGGNCIDLANIYRDGTSEEIVGEWIASRNVRDEVVIASKVGMQSSSPGLTRAAIERELQGSLERLGVDHIDLYYSHQDDLSTPIEETVQALGDAVEQGLVTALGASNMSGARLTASLQAAATLGVAGYEAFQPGWNLVMRDNFEADAYSVCRDHRIAILPYYGLASGFLTGKYRLGEPLPNSVRASRVQERYMTTHGFGVLAAMDVVAERHDATLTQVALAWLIAQPGTVIPIASATSPEQVRDIMSATSLQLSDDDLRELDRASKPEEDAGAEQDPA